MLSRLRQLTPSSGIFQSIVTIGGNFLSTGLSALALILISRFLGPVSFGEFSVGFAIIQILSRFNDAGLNATILKFAGGTSDQAQIKQTFISTIRLKALISILIIAVGLVAVKPLSLAIHFSPTLLLMSLIFSLASTWYEHLLTMLQALHRFSQAVICNTIQSGFKLVSIIGLWAAGAITVYPIFTWYMLAPLVAVLASPVLLPKWVFKRPYHLLQTKIPDGLIAMARHSAVGFIAAGLIENLDIVLVQKYLTSYEVGLLSGVSRIAMMLTLVAYSLGNVLYPRVARYKTHSDLWTYLRKSSLVMVASVVGFIAFLPFGPLLIKLTIGEAYLPGNLILIILMASAFLTLATIPFLALFYTYKADWYFSISGILQLAIVVVGNGVLVPQYGLEAAAWTRFVARLFLFLFTAILALWIYYREYHKEKSQV